MNNDKDIYLCVSLSHVYLSLLFIEKRKNLNNSILLLNAHDKQIYEQFKRIQTLLLKHGYFVDIRMRNRVKNILGIEEIESRKQYKRIQNQLGLGLDHNFILYNFAWNCQYAYTSATFFIKKCKVCVFVEEGVQTATLPPQPRYKVVTKKIMGGIVDFYKLDKLEGIYIQKPEIYPQEWGDKRKYLNVQVLVKALSNDTRETMLQVFLGDSYQKLRDINYENTGVIYTQALSEDGYISEKEKIEHYGEMVKYYSKYGTPIVKLHPRDKTQYPFSEQYIVLPPSFPSELLALLGIRFKYSVAICSSAVYSTNADTKLNLNENFNIDKKFQLIPLE